MLKFIFKKAGYGLLVLFGVITVVFFLFNLAPGDPVRNLLGENAPEQVAADMRHKFGLDLPIGTRYFVYLNDLSPISFHSAKDTASSIFFDGEKYSAAFTIPLPAGAMVAVKSPFLNRSFLTERSVASILGDVIPGTIVLAVVSMFFALLLGLIFGIIAALKKDTLYDRLVLIVSAIGMSGPSFFMAILVAWIGAILWRDEIIIPVFPLALLLLIGAMFAAKPANYTWARVIAVTRNISWVVLGAWIIGRVAGYSFSGLGGTIRLPGTGLNMTGSLFSVDVWKGQYLDLKNLVLPVLTLMIRPLAVVVQLTRSSMLEVLSMDFIRTARAKGLRERRVILVHALRNALNPVITAVSGWFASLLAGAVFVEFVFGWKGLGQQMFTAIEKQDLPVVMGGVIVISTAFVLINFLVDLVYGWIDPRIRLSGA